jgi:hypothetical protein
MSKRSYKFYYHYNKPASKQQKRDLMSFHFKGQCHIVPDIECEVKCKSKIRNRQPRIVMEGFASDPIITATKIIIR